MIDNSGHNPETDTVCLESEPPHFTVHSDVVKKLREYLGIPDLTADEIAVVLAERELDQARADKRINRWHWATGAPSTPCQTHTYPCKYVIALPALGVEKFIEHSTRLAAAQAAVEYVRGLQPPKPKLPNVGGMGYRDRAEEMGERGWIATIEHDAKLMWTSPKHQCIYQGNDETPRSFSIRALAMARRMDGDE